MIAIRCIVSAFSSGLNIPDPLLTLDSSTAEQYFAEASNNDIHLFFDQSAMENPSPATAREVDSLDLHNALKRMTGNPSSATKLQRIGLILAGTYKPRPKMFGLMFDWGRKFAFDQHDTSAFHGVAREGCAVFLDAIRALRPDDDDYRQQVAFTAIHELGHVFNLSHRSNPLSFMATSRVNDVFTREEGAFQFADGEKQLLRQCSQSPHIWPGGSGFRDLGPLAAADASWSASGIENGLELSVDIAPREFWPFEPVELDVQMRMTNAAKENYYRVPDAVDPGYEHFVIWIESPSGELRRYRSPRQYCWNGSRFTISPEKPFCRDISIFVEAGGYTFNQVGPHRVYVTFQVGRNRRLVSNKIEVFVRPARPDESTYCQAREVMTRASSAKLLYYRRASRTRREMKSLEHLANSCGQTAAAAIHYALGRANMKAVDTVKNLKRSTELTEAGIRHLEAATRRNLLGQNRLNVATRLIESNSGRTSRES